MKFIHVFIVLNKKWLLNKSQIINEKVKLNKLIIKNRYDNNVY